MKYSNTLKWISGSAEGFIGLPFIGAAVVVGSGYTVLALMFMLHMTTLVFSLREKRPTMSSLVGLITSCLAWNIDLWLGMLLHIITAVLLLLDALNDGKNKKAMK